MQPVLKRIQVSLTTTSCTKSLGVWQRPCHHGVVVGGVVVGVGLDFWYWYWCSCIAVGGASQKRVLPRPSRSRPRRCTIACFFSSWTGAECAHGEQKASKPASSSVTPSSHRKHRKGATASRVRSQFLQHTVEQSQRRRSEKRT